MDDRIHHHQLSTAERDAVLESLRLALHGVENVRLAYAFGSFVSGETFRDLDIAILLDDPDQWRTIGRVDGVANEVLDNLPFPVDVVPLNDATPRFRREVVTKGVLLYERETGEADDYYVSSLSLFMDFEAFLKKHERVS